MRLYSVPTHQFSHPTPLWHHQSLTPHSTSLNRYIPGHITCECKHSFGRARLKIHYDNYNPDSLLSRPPLHLPSRSLILFPSYLCCSLLINGCCISTNPQPPSGTKQPTPPAPLIPLFATFHRTKQKTPLFQYSPKRMKWKRRTASPAYCMWKAFFFTCMYVRYVLEKSVTREQNESTLSLLPSHFSHPACLPPSPSFLTHSTKTNPIPPLVYSTRITKITCKRNEPIVRIDK